MTDQCGQTLNMLAMSMPKKAETFAGGFRRRTDANVINICQAESMNSKAATADVAADFAVDVILRPPILGDGEDAHAAIVGSPN